MLTKSDKDLKPKAARIAVIGMGNTLMSDDGAGIRALRALRVRLGPDFPYVALIETAAAGPELTTLLEGFDEAIIVDALLTRDPRPGAIHVLDLEDLAHTRNTASPHSMNLATAVELGRRCGLRMPRRIRILAMEILDAETVSESLSPAVEKAIPEAVEILADMCIEYNQY
jgi:hydrogenase maturation protease